MDEKAPTDEFVFAQIEHEGAFNVHPNSATALLSKLARRHVARVNLKREVVDPGKDDLSNLSFLYLTDLDDFHLSDNAVTALRGFLQRNGTLFINNGLGLSTFDQAVRRELGPGAARLEAGTDSAVASDFQRCRPGPDRRLHPCRGHALRGLNAPKLRASP